MEIRIESILCNWDEKIPELFINLVNVLALTRNEDELRITIEKLSQAHEIDKFFAYGFGSHHFWLHQRYTSNPNMILANRLLSVHF